MNKKILITKGKVHPPCWKCYMLFFTHIHFRKLVEQGYIGRYFYPKKSREEFEVYNEKEVIHEDELKSEEFEEEVKEAQAKIDSKNKR